MTVLIGIVDAPVGRRPLSRRTNGHVPPPPPPGDDDGRPPEPRRPRLDNLRLAMLFFIGAEVMFFAGLVSAFLVLRTAAPVWPPPLQPRLPVFVTGLNTLVLLASSLTLAVAVSALAQRNGRALTRRLGLTATLGAVFLLVQGYEWVRLVGFGLTMASSTYGTTFYTLIGAHAVHVLGALIWLSMVALLAAYGRFQQGPAHGVRACAMYWHFVVALWPILYVAVYLL